MGQMLLFLPQHTDLKYHLLQPLHINCFIHDSRGRFILQHCYLYQYHLLALPLLLCCLQKLLTPVVIRKCPIECKDNHHSNFNLYFEQCWCICFDTTDNPKMVKTKKATSSKG